MVHSDNLKLYKGTMDNSWVFEKEPEETGIAEDAVSETSDIEEPIAGDHESEIQSGDAA